MQMRAEAGKMGPNTERGASEGDLDFFPTPSRSISTRLHRRSLFVVPREEVEEAMVEEAYLLYLLFESVTQSISACSSPPQFFRVLASPWAKEGREMLIPPRRSGTLFEQAFISQN